jgi:two-component sensor histidine kinase
MNESPRVDWRFAVACTVLIALLFGTQQWLNAPDSAPIAFLFSQKRAFAVWGAWLALLPLIIKVARAHPLGAEPRGKWIRYHLLMTAVFALTHSVLTAVLRALFDIPAAPNIGDAIAIVFFYNIAGDLLRYAFISLSYQVVAYHGLVRERDRQAAELEIDLAESKLANLEGQLRPHFLFNTLNSITALIREDPRGAETMLAQLSSLLRASLAADPSREIRLDEELELAEQYLAIQQVRFQDRLHVSLEATDAARRAFVPQLLLQPIAENAILHGLASRESGGSVWISAELIGDRLRLTVEDDGVGMGNSPRTSDGNGIGLRAVESRLAHRYGRAQRVEVTARRPAGTRVTIEIPYHTEVHDA